jgi:hypothetical protein
MEMWREVAPLFAVTAMAHHRLNVCRPDLRWADPQMWNLFVPIQLEPGNRKIMRIRHYEDCGPPVVDE